MPIQGLVTGGWLAVFAAGADGSLGYMRQTALMDGELYVRAEQAPNSDSRVVLGEGSDALGQEQPVLHWRLLREDEPWPYDPAAPSDGQTSTWGNHHIGTTRMSAGVP